MQPPRLLHTNKSRHTCSGYGSRRSPEPCSCRSDPWPCIRGLAGPGPPACPLATHAANMAVRSMFICPRRDSSTDPDFYSKCRMLVLWPPKQVTRSINKKGSALAKAHVNSPKVGSLPVKGGVLFCHSRIGIVEMAICKIDTSFPLHPLQSPLGWLAGSLALSAFETTSHNMQQYKLGDRNTRTPRSSMGQSRRDAPPNHVRDSKLPGR